MWTARSWPIRESIDTFDTEEQFPGYWRVAFSVRGSLWRISSTSVTLLVSKYLSHIVQTFPFPSFSRKRDSKPKHFFIYYGTTECEVATFLHILPREREGSRQTEPNTKPRRTPQRYSSSSSKDCDSPATPLTGREKVTVPAGVPTPARSAMACMIASFRSLGARIMTTSFSG